MTKQELYEQMIGVSGNEFADQKSCVELYEKVYKARIRLSKRTGIDFEDRDLLEIIEALEEIGKMCALKMFDYGKMQMDEI